MQSLLDSYTLRLDLQSEVLQFQGEKSHQGQRGAADQEPYRRSLHALSGSASVLRQVKVGFFGQKLRPSSVACGVLQRHEALRTVSPCRTPRRKLVVWESIDLAVPDSVDLDSVDS